MICLDIVLFSEVLRSTSKTLNMTWLYSGTCWCMWFAEAAVWYGYTLCYSRRLVMCTEKEVVCLFTWRLFSIPVPHLTWLDETVPNCVKCIINFLGMLCILENGALQKWCIFVYWRACRWYDWTGFTWRLFSIPVLHLTWLNETVPSCVKCIINFSGMLCILENDALQKDAYMYWRACRWYDWTGFNSASHCWATHAALQSV